MKKIFIAGCGGMLGEAFYEYFTEQNYDILASDIDLNAKWLTYLDFRDHSSYLKIVNEFNPDFIFHLGAFTDLEYCEKNSYEAYLTNTISVENAVNISNALNVPLLYISTAGIFDGLKNLYDDWDTPNPLGVYARTKYLGEKFVLERAIKPFVCRAGWMMGGGPEKDKKFIQKLMYQLKSGNKQLFVVNDKDGTPTYTLDFAKNCHSLIKTEFFGLYNMVCQGETSRFEVASHLLDILGLDKKIELIPVESSFFANKYFAARPNSERLINSKLNMRGLNNMQDWKFSLNHYINSRYSNYL